MVSHIIVSISQSVTLGDEAASRRGVQKTVLERKGPSTFSCGVEIISKNELRVHPNLEETVDAILSGIFSFNLLMFHFRCLSSAKWCLFQLSTGFDMLLLLC